MPSPRRLWRMRWNTAGPASLVIMASPSIRNERTESAVTAASHAPILCRRAKTRKLSCPLRARGQGAFAGEGQTWLAQRHNGLMETALQRVQSQRLCAPEEPWTTNLGPLVRRPLRRPLPACLFPENGRVQSFDCNRLDLRLDRRASAGGSHRPTKI
jgi:hypothetical protein